MEAQAKHRACSIFPHSMHGMQFAQTEAAVKEADKWSKIVESRLKEAQAKGQLSDELKAESDEAKRLEIEARNEAK